MTKSALDWFLSPFTIDIVLDFTVQSGDLLNHRTHLMLGCSGQ